MGSKYITVKASWNDSGIKPPALENEPRISSHLHPYLDAYNTLRCHRTKSEAGYNPISYESLITYAKVYGFDDTFDELNTFCVLVQSCDHALLDYADEVRSKAMAAASKKK